MPPIARKIKVVETGKIYMSARTCARHIDGDFSSIYACLRGEHTKHKGYTFEYVEGEQ